jgi:FKBP-type peptidyl-prolyl cis-trans isomerase (trigger factor)
MKKKLAVICLCAACVLAGCSSSKTTVSSASSEVTSSAASSEVAGGEGTASDASYPYDSAPATDTTLEGSASVMDFISLGNYKELEINVPDGAAVEDGMVVNIDYTGYMDGTAFDGGSASDYNLTIGSNTFIDGFEEQIIGHKAGEEFDVNVTFPEDYSAENLAGKEATFKVKINSIKKQTITDALQKVIDSSTVKAYPQDLLDAWTERFDAAVQSSADAYSMDVDEYKTQAGITDEMVSANVKSSAKADLVVRAMMEAEGITTDSDSYKEAQQTVFSNYGITSADQASSMNISEFEMNFLIRYQVAMNLISQYAV